MNVLAWAEPKRNRKNSIAATTHCRWVIKIKKLILPMEMITHYRVNNTAFGLYFWHFILLFLL